MRLKKIPAAFLFLFLFVAGSFPLRAGVLINEFMTSNSGFLNDQDGESSDWIEIFNNSAANVNLAGWHLTDNPAFLTKWTFPSTNLSADGYMIIFASGKNRSIAGAELHTNFQLNNGGGYLALTQSNGVTVAHAYDYPNQRVNVSYGSEGAANPAAALRLDFNDTASTDAPDTETGFNTMTLSANPSTFSGITVTLSALNQAPLASRDRTNPVQTATLTQDQLYDDFIFANSTVLGAGLRILITGLSANQNYTVKIWSMDAGASTQGNRVADWTESASGVTNIVRNGYTWNVSNPPLNDGDNTFSATMRSSSSGVLQIEGRQNGGVSSAVYLNALELTEDATGGTNLAARYFNPATPGAANGTGYFGLVADTKFSVNRGFYDAPFSVVITNATTNSTIRWTTNGTTPTVATGNIYSGAIPISGTSYLRAAAFLSGYLPSDTDTQTYIFLNQMMQQSGTQPGFPTTWPQGSTNYPADYGMDPNVVNHPVYSATISNDMRSIPTLSLVMPFEDFWETSTGIYNHATSEGPTWERAASAELINTNGETEFSINCGIQMQGNASRDNARTPKHSIRLLFKSDFGPTKLSYPWFAGPVEQFNTVILRACFTDSWSTRYSDSTVIPGGKGTRYRPEDSLLLRDIWVKDCLRDMGWLSGRCNFVHLYLNGLYWGVYDPVERLDADFFSSHLGGRPEEWDVLRDFSEVLEGNKNDWNAMMALCNAGITSEATYQAINQLVDVENLIDYMMLHIYAEAEDWPQHNWYAAHRRANATNGFPATKWIFLSWDQEIVLDQLVRRNQINANVNDTPSRIYTQLRNWPEFRRIFGDRIQKHLFNGGALTASNNIARMQARAAQIDRAIVGESARWGDAREFATPGNPATGQTFTRDEWWLPELQKLYTNFFQTLNATNVARFRGGNLYPTISAPIFSQFGGAITQGFALTITQTNGSGVIYFTTDGTDPRQYGTGSVAPTAIAYSSPITLNAVTTVRARVLAGGSWSALTEAVFFPPQDLSKLALTEIMYNPPALGGIAGNDLEFLELKNVGANTLNLSGLTFSAGITFTFTNGTMLAPNQFFVLARNATAFATKYPGVTVKGVYSGQLDNSGEQLTLSLTVGGDIFSVTYDDLAPWPVAPDGYGFSLVPKTPGLTQAPDDGSKWRASPALGGSPGADDPAPAIAPIVVNEILPHTDPPQKDSIELFNPTGSAVNIGGWYLTDSAATPKKFRIPDNTIIPAGGYVFFNEDNFNAGIGTNINFAFASTGEEVYLFSAGANGELSGYSHGFAFGAMFNGVSLGRFLDSVGEEFFPSQISLTLSATNSGPRVGPIVFNEIQYNPDVNGDEFVELLNITGNPVSFFDPLFPTNAWKIGGIGFTFPTNVSLAPAQLLLVVATNPAVFRAKYNVPQTVQIFGPYSGALDNNGESLTIEVPDTPNTNGIPYVVIEDVRYNDKAPWPPGADGSGLSLQRVSPNLFSSEPTNWIAVGPTPGQPRDNADTDGDGIPDAYEMAHGSDPFTPDSDGDLDGDGASNLVEYQAGTDPQVAQNFYRLGLRLIGNGTAGVLDFQTLPGKNYFIERTPSLSPTNWVNVFSLSAVTNSRPVNVTNAIFGGEAYYRLRIQ